MTTPPVHAPPDEFYTPPDELYTPDGALYVPPAALYQPEGGKFKDPPEVLLGGSDRPMEEWPGTMQRWDSVARASGNQRDWFGFYHRLAAHVDGWRRFWQTRRRRTSYHQGFHWNQILVIGDYGLGKTTGAMWAAYPFWEDGHAIFHNGPYSIGWLLQDEQLFTAMAVMPDNAVLIVDEGQSWLTGRLANSTAVDTFLKMSANIRKKNCWLIIMSAQSQGVDRRIRGLCKEVWRPVEFELEMEDDDRTSSRAPANDPSKFVLAIDVWDDYPFRRNDEIDGPDSKYDGFGDPDYTWFDSGDSVRNAFLLTNTFELADAGGAMLADREVIKDDLRRQRGDQETNGYSKTELQVLGFLETMRQHPGSEDMEYVSAGDIGRSLGINAGVVGRAMTSLFGPELKSRPRHGYKAEQLWPEVAKYYPDE